MRTVGLSVFGGPEVVEVSDVGIPEPRAGQVRIAVEAAAINPVDAATREGMLHELGFHGKPPLTLGWDVAGTVDAVGSGMRRLSSGDRVVGISTHLFGGPKAQSDFIVLNESAVAALPTELEAGPASTLPLAGLTAWQALDALDLRRGQSLLVTGAGGAVGGFAIQLARIRGLRVVAAGSARHSRAIEARGADWFVNSDELASSVRRIVPGGVDGALDAASLGQPSLDAVVDRGAHVSLMVLECPAALRGVRSESFAVRASWEQLTVLAALAASGALLTDSLRSFSFDEAAEAYRVLARGGLTGERLILQP